MQNVNNANNENNLEDVVGMVDPEFTPDGFSWEITSSDEEARENEKEQFKIELNRFKAVTDAIMVPEDKLPFIIDFYDTIISDNIWNEYMEKHFKTKLQKNLNLNSQRKLN